LGRSATGGGSVLIFVKNFCETFLRQIGQVINVNLHKSSFKVGLIVILVGLLRNLNFLSRFSKNTQTTHFMKTLSVGADLFHADGQTDSKKLIIAFRNFANALKSRPLSVRLQSFTPCQWKVVKYKLHYSKIINK